MVDLDIGIQNWKVRTLDRMNIELGGMVPKDEEISKRAKDELRSKVEPAEEEK